MTLKKRWNIWSWRRQKTMPLPGTSLESCFVRENWCRRILLEELAEAGVASAAYIAGKVYLKEEGWKDVQKAIRCFHMAAENSDSYAEYQLGKIYYFGNGIRADREKGLEYLNQSAAHGNVYAENLLWVIRQQHIRGAASLIVQLGRMFQEKEQQDRVQHQQPDRKQRRQIDEKKQAMGIRD